MNLDVVILAYLHNFMFHYYGCQMHQVTVNDIAEDNQIKSLDPMHAAARVVDFRSEYCCSSYAGMS